MTENEAIQVLTSKYTSIETSKCDDVEWRKLQPAIDEAVKSLEEIQQYRSIGTVEEVKRMQRYSALAKKHSTIGQVIESCAEYESIGTIEEFRNFIERFSVEKHL